MNPALLRQGDLFAPTPAEVTDNSTPLDAPRPSLLKPLRPLQAKALDMLRDALKRGKRRPIIKAPTGFGKGVLASHIIDGARKKGNRVVFVINAAASQSLLNQMVNRLHAEGVRDLGVMMGDHALTDSDMPVQVCSIQTLRRRMIPPGALVLVDEAHVLNRLYADWMNREEWANVPFIGLSATPYSRGLGKLYDELIIPCTTRELIERGDLAPYRCIGADHPDLSGLKMVRDKDGIMDYREEDVARVMDGPKIYGNVVEAWCKWADGRPTLTYAVKRANAAKIQQEFQKNGIPWGYIDCNVEEPDRLKQFEQLRKGEIKGIANVATLTTGLDLPFISCIQLVAPTNSPIKYQQIFGRGLRTCEGKTDLLFIDHTDTVQNRLGEVTDVDEEFTELDDGKPKKASKKKKKTPLPKECGKCGVLKPARARVCPHCGFQAENIEAIESKTAEMVELNGKEKKVKREDKQKWLSMFVGYAQERNKTWKFVLAMFKNKFGEWPRGLVEDYPLTPDYEVSNYIRSRNIAYAKSRELQA